MLCFTFLFVLFILGRLYLMVLRVYSRFVLGVVRETVGVVRETQQGYQTHTLVGCMQTALPTVLSL